MSHGGDTASLATLYDRTRGGESRGEALAAVLAPELSTASPVLDVGLGTGIVTLALKRRGHRVLGVDLSADMLARARERLGPVVARGDAVRLPLASAAIDQVVSVWVLQVVRDLAAALSEVRRVLRPGGRYVVIPGMLRPAQDAIGTIVDRLWTRLDPDGSHDDRSERLVPLAEKAGLRAVTLRLLPLKRFNQSPAAAAEWVESGTLSMFWRIDAATWQSAVTPVVAELRGLQEQVVPRERTSQRELLVFTRD